MTDPVGPLNRAFEVLRRQIAEHARQLDSGNRTQTSGASNAARSSVSDKSNIGELKQRITDRLQGIDPQSPNAGRRRRRIFLESTLAGLAAGYYAARRLTWADFTIPTNLLGHSRNCV